MRGRHFTDPRRSRDQRMPDLVADVHPDVGFGGLNAADGGVTGSTSFLFIQ